VRRIVHDSLPDTTEHQPRTPSRVHDSLPDTKPWLLRQRLGRRYLIWIRCSG